MPNKPSEFSLQFREAMAHLPAAVSIVTSNGKAGKVGLTVSSVNSVSDTPATLLFCVNRNSYVHDIIKQNGKVCINVLSHNQEELAKHFASMLNSTMEERFEWNIWKDGTDNQPVLQGAIASLQGNLIDTHSIGTHSIFIVELTHIDVTPNHSLVYFSRQFKKLTLE